MDCGLTLTPKWRVMALQIRTPSVGASPGCDTCVRLSKTLNHCCFVLRMGRKAVGLVCCVKHVK